MKKYATHKPLLYFLGSFLGLDARLTLWAWTTYCKNWVSITPGLRSPSGCSGVWWTPWTRFCQCSSRNWAPLYKTRRRGKAEIKRTTEDTLHYTTLPYASLLYIGQSSLTSKCVDCKVFYYCAMWIVPSTCRHSSHFFIYIVRSLNGKGCCIAFKQLFLKRCE